MGWQYFLYKLFNFGGGNGLVFSDSNNTTRGIGAGVDILAGLGAAIAQGYIGGEGSRIFS